ALLAPRLHHQPELVGRDLLVLGAEIAEAVEEPVAARAPVPELDAELERAPRLAQEFGLADAELGIEHADGGKRRLADADRADILRFDELDLDDRRIQEMPERGGRHPSGRTAADDHDPAYAPVRHGPVFRHAGGAAQLRAMKSPWNGRLSAARRMA